MAPIKFPANMRPFLLPVFACILLCWQQPVLAQDFLDEFQEQSDELGGAVPGEEAGAGVINQYDERYKKQNNPIETNNSLLPTANYLVRFVRTADSKPGQAVLRLISPVVINGCAKIAQPGVTIQQNGQLMMITVGEAMVNIDRSIRYAHFQCDQSGQTARADIILDHPQMLADEVTSILLQAGPLTDYFDVAATADTLTLKPRSTRAFKPFFKPGTSEPLMYQAYPDNLVLLEAPSAKANDNIAAAVDRLARGKGLQNGDALPQGLKNNQNNSGHTGQKYYFIDTTGQYAKNIAFGTSAFFDTLTISETLRGPQGPYETPKALDVYVKRPGEFD
jgi:hypothetical protein